MKKRKKVLGIFGITIQILVVCTLLFASSLYYKSGMVDRAIVIFGIAMIGGMLTAATLMIFGVQSITDVISQKLDKQLSYLEKLMERLENKDI